MGIDTCLMIVAVCSLLAGCAVAAPPEDDAGAREIGSRLEPLVDDWLVDSMDGVSLQLHHPTPQEIAVHFDAPCEGSTCCYVTVFEDDDRFRMYYRGSNYDVETRKTTHPEFACYAESTDGIHWEKPNLGIIEFEGNKDNNIVWAGIGCHNFTPFKDTNPNCTPDARYKAIGGGNGGLVTYKSADAIHWELISDKPVITRGAFDSQNLAFYDNERGRYVDFHRQGRDGVRDIMTCYSDDFVNWTEPDFLSYGTAAKEHLYTNAITPYFRAPHIFFGFPKRFMPSRNHAVHPVKGISDGVFMTSRDGVDFHRWGEAFVRPGLQPERWINRNNMTAWGILQTKAADPGMPDELSIYSTEAYYIPGDRLRRFTIRMDGFVSVNAKYPGGELVTKPLVFDGKELVINFSTSAIGFVRAEITDADGAVIPGFAMDDCEEIFGDEIEHVVSWKGGSDVGALAGKPVRLRFAMRDADLYSIRFRP